MCLLSGSLRKNTNMAVGAPEGMLKASEEESAFVIAWTPPVGGSWKLNFAGHYDEEETMASVGCLVRDRNAVFKSGFARPLGTASCLSIAQLTAFKRAPDFAISEGIDYLEIEGNHLFMFRMIFGEIVSTDPEVRALVAECLYDLGQIRSVTLRPVQIYDNLAANRLAKIALERQQSCIWFDDPPPEEIAHILDRDVTGRCVAFSSSHE